ncbi:DUF3562 domain-containing protein [Neisseriaceae bacterium JH1-16]|nr:DUF3562 domain-containing protein [Neisseriaceae bacterium JH1-16]
MTDDAYHQDILDIAQKTGISEEIVSRIYDEIFQSLSAEAVIKDYLRLLARKHVHRRLKDMRRISKSSMPQLVKDNENDGHGRMK